MLSTDESSAPRPIHRSRRELLRGRTPHSRLLPVLGLLLGALCVFHAAPAQAQPNIWSTRLTVDVDGNNTGCDNLRVLNVTACSSALANDSFTYGGTEYRIRCSTMPAGRGNSQ